MSKRPIAALAVADLTPGTPPTKRPELSWIKPGDLLIDGDYQRDLSDRSLKLIHRIVEQWDWRRFKPPIVAWTGDGLEVIDGQHSAIAAATHPEIVEIPVVVVEAAGQTDRASAFIGHNRDRLGMTATQLHAAAVTAGEEEAIAIERVASAAGLRVLRTPPGRSEFKPGDVMAVGNIATVIKRRGEDRATQVLQILSEAGCAPVTAQHIRAVDLLLTDPEFAELDVASLAAAIKTMGDEPAEQAAKTFSATHRLSTWRAYAAIWFRAAKKRRKPAPAPAMPPLAAPAAARAAPVGDGLKRDARPARGGWAPGAYLNRCQTCDERFVGVKLGRVCADCAYSEGKGS